MKWVAEIVHKSMRFIIEEEEFQDLTENKILIWYYLYVYENGVEKFDYLQDTCEIAMSQALRKFGVPYDAWKQVA